MFTPLVLFVSCVVLSGVQSDTDESTDFRPQEPQYPECGPNEELNYCVQQCRGEDSCYDRYSIACPAVIQPCVPACVCKEGFIRKTVGRECIPVEECGGPCDIYSRYSDCQQASKETCSSIGNPTKSEDCAEACTPGCACWDGYYRANETEPCMPRCFCPELQNTPECESWRSIG